MQVLGSDLRAFSSPRDAFNPRSSVNSFKDKVVVVAGATGVIGSGVARRFLDEGATVVSISRDPERLQLLRTQLEIKPGESLLDVVGEFKTEQSAAEVRATVKEVLGGRPVDHVVAALGFFSIDSIPTATSLSTVKHALDDGLLTNFLAAQAFLPELETREGSSFTLVSGGLAHSPPADPRLWLGTLKNAAVNALTWGLASETLKSEVRVNTVCIHFNVAPHLGTTNRFGMPAEGTTRRLAPVFTRLARSTTRGQVICLSGWADAEKWGS